MRRSAARGLLPALVVLGLVAVVAVAATGSTDRGTDATRAPSAIFLDVAVALGIVWVLAVAAILVWALINRDEVARQLPARKQPRSPLAVLLFLVLVSLAAAVAWRLRERRGAGLDSEGTPAPPGGQDATPPPPEAYDPSLSWLTVTIVVALVVGSVAAYAVARRRERHLERSQESLAESLAHALDDSLSDLLAEADPRLAVVAAYARMEKVLAAHGFPRSAAETPEEYLTRILASLDIQPASVRRLTDLYAWAKFSDHDVAPAMKRDAVESLAMVRDELRRLPAAEVARTAPITVGAGS